MQGETMVAEFDRDEAVAEAMAGLEESTRGDLFRRTGVLAGLGLAATLLPAGIASARRGGSESSGSEPRQGGRACSSAAT